jgi:hypothetical protein
MISRALQSLDAWLAQADEVLAEQTAYSQSQPERLVRPSHERGRRSETRVVPSLSLPAPWLPYTRTRDASEQTVADAGKQ